MAELPTYRDILLDYPGAVPNESPRRIQRFIDKAAAKLVEADWCGDWAEAVVLLALHNLASNPTPIEESATPDNPIAAMGLDPSTIKTIDIDGEIAVTLHSPKDMGATGYAGAGGDGTLSSTKWGRAFLELEARRCKHMAFGRDDREGHLTRAANRFDEFNHFTDAYQ